MTPQPDLSSWPSKAQTAELLGLGERTLDRMIARKKCIETRMRPRADGRKPEVACNPEDVQRVLSERKGTTTVIAKPGEGLRLSLYPPPSGIGGQFSNLQEFAKVLKEFIVPPPPMPQKHEEKLWLTLKEASAYSGLSMALLQRLARDGMVQAVKDNGWKFRRYALDGLDDIWAR